ncbi:nickel transporter [Streptomyces sp. MAA16]|uniref:nickel transporter n=1 Tax=Streptomyces sp. MAA16 TaxID=3035116 RepID=UPI0024752CFE|nr:nickel transporter [Streptomyces sp. MAA16]MDH6696238.1 nickel/cobalt exporter [Streptomyces sp. MAA16]
MTPTVPVSRRRAASWSATLLLPALAALACAGPAAAHPLGDFTVNHATSLTLRPDRIDATIVVDRAEIAAAQEQDAVDSDHDGQVDAGERAAYATRSCHRLTDELRTRADGVPLRWRGTSGAFDYRPGQAGLRTSLLTCHLTTRVDLTRRAAITLDTGYDMRRIGWHEITARGAGLTLAESDVPSVSRTQELRHYPRDPLAAPLDQRAARLTTAPGANASAVSTSVPATGVGPVTAVLDRVSAYFDRLVGARRLTLPIGFLALLLAIVLGASHAVLPGHGKTLMAAYLAGRRGTRRDAVTVGATVTVTHTAGVLALGLALPLATHLAGETVLTWLGLASGLLISGIGLRLLRDAARGETPTRHHHHHGHGHGHGHGRWRGHGHGHGHHGHGDHADHGHGDIPAGHQHPLPRDRSAARTSPATRTGQATAGGTSVAVAVVPPQSPAPAPAPAPAHPHPDPHPHPASKPSARRSKAGLIGMGIAGGLVPSPSALVVLLGAVALGRTAFGVLLVVGYGLGMAGTLTLAGLLLLRIQDRLDRRTTHHHALRRRLARATPLLTAGLVLAVGLGLSLQAATGL